MPNPGIELKARITELSNGCHRLQCWVNDSHDISENIFVYQRFPSVPGESSPDDRFVNVASVADLNEYPNTTPGAGSPFFRLSRIDLTFRSVDLLDRTWDLIQEDANALVTNLIKLETLGTDITVDINMSAYNSSSSSSESSESSIISRSSSSSSSLTSTPKS